MPIYVALCDPNKKEKQGIKFQHKDKSKSECFVNSRSNEPERQTGSTKARHANDGRKEALK
jgi:hypothetical protein